MPIQTSRIISSGFNNGSLKKKYWVLDSFGSNTGTAGKFHIPHPNKLDSYVGKYQTVNRVSYDGRVLWSRTAPDSLIQGGGTDSSGNVYIVSGSTNVTKYSQDGALLWSKNIGTGSSGDCNIAVASSGNVYVVSNDSSGYVCFIKLNSSGTKLWDRRVTIIGNGTAVGVDEASSRCYFGYFSTSSSIFKSYLTAFDLDGNTQWSKVVEDSSTNRCFPRGIAASGGVVHFGTSIGYYVNAIYKYNTSGTLQSTIGASDPSFYPWPAVSINSSGQLFVSHYDSSVAKYDSSSNLLWSRRVSSNTGYVAAFGAGIDDNGVCYHASYNGGSYGGVYSKIPANGAGIGQYGPRISITNSATTIGYLTSVYNSYMSAVGVSVSTPSYTMSDNTFTPSTSREPSEFHVIRT